MASYLKALNYPETAHQTYQSIQEQKSVTLGFQNLHWWFRNQLKRRSPCSSPVSITDCIYILKQHLHHSSIKKPGTLPAKKGGCGGVCVCFSGRLATPWDLLTGGWPVRSPDIRVTPADRAINSLPSRLSVPLTPAGRAPITWAAVSAVSSPGRAGQAPHSAGRWAGNGRRDCGRGG